MSEEYTTVFPPYYEGAEMFRGNAGWENPPYYLTAYGLAVKHGYVGTEEEWLASLKGDPGPGIVIWGHYDTLAELEEDVTDPEDGEMYDVGSGAAQLVYYWSGEEWLPLNIHGPQGETGPAGADGAPGVDGADGASAYEQAVEAGYSGTEQEFMALLADLPGYTEQARLWAVAAGEAESAAEGYAESAAESAAAAGAASSVSYDNTDSGLTATNVQDAIDEVAQGGGGGGGSAGSVSYDNSASGLTATNVQDAIDEVVEDIPTVPAAYTSNPEMDGTASAGSSGNWARGDHVHPSDTSRVPTTRTINGKALSADVSLSARDVGAQKPIVYDNIVFPLSWSGSGPYTEIVTTQYVEVEDEALVSLMPTAAQLSQLMADGVTALIVENNMGTLTAYALGAAPTTSMIMGCTLTSPGIWGT